MDLLWKRHAGAMVATMADGFEYAVMLVPPFVAAWKGSVQPFSEVWAAFHACEVHAGDRGVPVALPQDVSK